MTEKNIPSPRPERSERPSDSTPHSKRRDAWRIGQIWGIPLHLEPSWILLTVVIIFGYGSFLEHRFGLTPITGYLSAGSFAVLLAVSVLLHEIGHAASARAFGWRVLRIDLSLMGGHTRFLASEQAPLRCAVVSLIGPLVNLAIAGVCWMVRDLAQPQGAAGLVLYLMVMANALVGLFNLLPGLPLDGGHALVSLITALTGRRRWGLQMAAGISLVLSLGLCIGAVAAELWRTPLNLAALVLVVWFLISGALSGLRRAQLLLR